VVQLDTSNLEAGDILRPVAGAQQGNQINRHCPFLFAVRLRMPVQQVNEIGTLESDILSSDSASRPAT